MSSNYAIQIQINIVFISFYVILVVDDVEKGKIKEFIINLGDELKFMKMLILMVVLTPIGKLIMTSCCMVFQSQKFEN